MDESDEPKDFKEAKAQAEKAEAILRKKEKAVDVADRKIKDAQENIAKWSGELNTLRTEVEEARAEFSRLAALKDKFVDEKTRNGSPPKPEGAKAVAGDPEVVTLRAQVANLSAQLQTLLKSTGIPPQESGGGGAAAAEGALPPSQTLVATQNYRDTEFAEMQAKLAARDAEIEALKISYGPDTSRGGGGAARSAPYVGVSAAKATAAAAAKAAAANSGGKQDS